MDEVVLHGVTIDRCLGCSGLWFDVDEIYAFLNAHPELAVADEPIDHDFKRCTSGIGATCGCCGQQAVEIGDFRGIAYQRCTWCGGLFIGREEIRKIVASRSGQITVPETESMIPAPVWVAGGAIAAAAFDADSQNVGKRPSEGIAPGLEGVLEIGGEVVAEGGGELVGAVLYIVFEFVLEAIAGVLSG